MWTKYREYHLHWKNHHFCHRFYYLYPWLLWKGLLPFKYEISHKYTCVYPFRIFMCMEMHLFMQCNMWCLIFSVVFNIFHTRVWFINKCVYVWRKDDGRVMGSQRCLSNSNVFVIVKRLATSVLVSIKINDTFFLQ